MVSDPQKYKQIAPWKVGKDTKFISSRAIITLSHANKKYYVNLYEAWEPISNYLFYGVELGNVSNSIIKDSNGEQTKLIINPNKLEEDLIRTGFKEAKGKKAASVRVADKTVAKLKQIIGSIDLKDCEKIGQVEKEGDFKFHREFRYDYYDYEHGEISYDSEQYLRRMVKKYNSYPDYIYLDAEFNSEKGFFYVIIRLTQKARQMLIDDPEKLEKELKL